MLTAHGISQKGITTVTSYLKDHHYQLACQKYYEITHAVSHLVFVKHWFTSSPSIQIDAAPFSLEHPSQYYRESRQQRGHTGAGVMATIAATARRPPGIKTEPQQSVKAEEDYCGNISVEDMQSFEEDMEQWHKALIIAHFLIHTHIIMYHLLAPY